jgi:hypothetical protein
MSHPDPSSRRHRVGERAWRAGDGRPVPTGKSNISKSYPGLRIAKILDSNEGEGVSDGGHAFVFLPLDSVNPTLRQTSGVDMSAH